MENVWKTLPDYIIITTLVRLMGRPQQTGAFMTLVPLLRFELKLFVSVFVSISHAYLVLSFSNQALFTWFLFIGH